MKMLNDESGFGNIIYGVVGLVIFVILVSSVALPVWTGTNTTVSTRWIDSFNCGAYGNTTCGTTYINTTHYGNLTVVSGWDAPAVAMWGIVPLVIVASLIMYAIGKK